MAPFESLYRRKCRSPIGWFEVGETAVSGPDSVAYEVELPSELSSVHPIFHVSMLRKHISDAVVVDSSVLWRNQSVEGATWEDEADMRSKVRNDVVMSLTNGFSCMLYSLSNLGMSSVIRGRMFPRGDDILDLNLALVFQEKLSDPRITSMLKRKGRHSNRELANLLQDKGLDPNFVVMLKENGLDPMILALLQRSSLDVDREHCDSNPPFTDSNNVEELLPNHISFSEEIRLQGLGKYYYNKVIRTSKWIMPDKVKLAREKNTISHASDFGSISVVKTSSSGADGSLVWEHSAKSSPIFVSPVANLPTILASESSSLSDKVSSSMIETVEMKNSLKPASPAVANLEKIGIAVTLGNSVTPPISETTTQDAVVYGDGFSSENRENVKKDAAITEIGGATPSDEKIVELGPLVYESKAEGKSAFQTLLESTNIGKAIFIFEHDERFKAVERAKDREDLFEDYVEELDKKVKLFLQNFLVSFYMLVVVLVLIVELVGSRDRPVVVNGGGVGGRGVHGSIWVGYWSKP
ncbi:hypothetical protein T459_28809 [Capsicum annuum]|uniref:FF domain-containing protein n=1 Tax=Capsicum annuum TaxID=4072 RepID=A0A2G2YHU4_CAPAN|nr:hypothetical protein FXO37_28909 [Capsicum annuum]PHT69322.1 hypothetical protein T459_28809 [Capsicum annuum]